MNKCVVLSGSVDSAGARRGGESSSVARAGRRGFAGLGAPRTLQYVPDYTIDSSSSNAFSTKTLLFIFSLLLKSAHTLGAAGPVLQPAHAGHRTVVRSAAHIRSNKMPLLP